jgi:hypothetical protein
MNWTDTAFPIALKEQEPGNRARFLARAYATDKDSFAKPKETPDEMLVREYGEAVYVQLANQLIVPIAAVPAGIMLAKIIS